MTASKQFKALLSGVAAVALIGTAMAQGSPPNPAIKSAPVGAGQQSTQGTPMGDTGTPSGSNAARTGSTSGSSNMGSTSSSSGMTSGSASGTTSMGSGSTSADTSMTTRPMRTARADRN